MNFANGVQIFPLISFFSLKGERSHNPLDSNAKRDYIPTGLKLKNEKLFVLNYA